MDSFYGQSWLAELEQQHHLPNPNQAHASTNGAMPPPVDTPSSSSAVPTPPPSAPTPNLNSVLSNGMQHQQHQQPSTTNAPTSGTPGAGPEQFMLGDFQMGGDLQGERAFCGQNCQIRLLIGENCTFSINLDNFRVTMTAARRT